MPYQEITKSDIPEVVIFTPKVFGDERGWYSPVYEASEFLEATGINPKITQEGESFNASAGILRGLHYQIKNTQGKLVRVISGSVLDVTVDLRKESPTFGKSLAVVLSAENHKQLWVPPQFAHGFLALEPNTRFCYLVTEGIYDKEAERGINPFDPDLNINWTIPQSQISLVPRDLTWKNLKDVPTEDLF